MTTPPFYSEERWGLYHMCIISQKLVRCRLRRCR